MSEKIADKEAVREKVRAGYAGIAQKDSSCCSGASCCGSNAEDSVELAKYVGYSAEELAALPEGANMGLSCGNPNALAALKPGEVVLDLGSGGGFDVFIAARKVGATGRAIGVDMTPEMLAKARKNAGPYRERSGLDNVEFRLGELKMVEALVGCVAGAVLVSETERMAREAGLTDIRLKPKTDYVEAMTEWNDPLYKKIVEQLPAGSGPGDYITSLEVTAFKPGKTCCCG
jgi:SAM-dependent methyltransferase